MTPSNFTKFTSVFNVQLVMMTTGVSLFGVLIIIIIIIIIITIIIIIFFIFQYIFLKYHPTMYLM